MSLFLVIDQLKSFFFYAHVRHEVLVLFRNFFVAKTDFSLRDENLGNRNTSPPPWMCDFWVMNNIRIVFKRLFDRPIFRPSIRSNQIRALLCLTQLPLPQNRIFIKFLAQPLTALPFFFLRTYEDPCHLTLYHLAAALAVGVEFPRTSFPLSLSTLAFDSSIEQIGY